MQFSNLVIIIKVVLDEKAKEIVRASFKMKGL